MSDREDNAPKPTKVEIEGLEVAPGTFKTSSGTIKIPQSRLRKKQEPPQVPNTSVNDSFQPERVSHKLPEINFGKAERVAFKTDIGSMPSMYNPVIDLPDWVVLGVLPESFIPVSYKENNKMKMEISSPSIETCKVVYTGCKFTDSVTRTTYIILMKVNDD